MESSTVTRSTARSVISDLLQIVFFMSIVPFAWIRVYYLQADGNYTSIKRRNNKKMEDKRFQMNDSGFICRNCGMEVKPLGVTSRDHCPKCLCSIHIDINPGDRANDCLGLLRPVQVLPDPKKGYIIVYRCEKCGGTVRNKAAYPAKVQPDDINLLIRLTAGAGYMPG